MGVMSWLKKGASGVTYGGDVPYQPAGLGSMSQWPWLMPSTRIDYRNEAGDPLANSIIGASLAWIARTFPEAPLRVMRTTGEKPEPVPKHPALDILKQPNPYYNGLLLWQATLMSLNVDGNGYWLKARNGQGGLLAELWFEPHMTIRPIWPEDGSEFISGYQVKRRGIWQSKIIPRADVLHFRNGIDPMNPRMGLSPLASLFREIFTDNEAGNFSAALLRNMGVPGVLVSPKTADYTIADPQGLKDSLIAKLSGDRRGEPLVMEGPTTMEVLSWSPEQMNLAALRATPEERITALMGIPAVVVGMGAGLARSTYNNVAEAKASAYENNLLPTQRLLAAQLDTDLLPEFSGTENDEFSFDTSGVQALAEDQVALFKSLSLSYQSGWLKRADARRRSKLDLEIDDTDEVYYTDLVRLNAQLKEQEAPGTILNDDEADEEAEQDDQPAVAPIPPAKPAA